MKELQRLNRNDENQVNQITSASEIGISPKRTNKQEIDH
jgi:hypothetical protein